MRLLSKTELQKTKQSQDENDLRKNYELSQAIIKQTKLLNSLKTTFKAEIEILDKNKIKLEQLAQSSKQDLLREIEALEARRRAIEESCDERAWEERHRQIQLKEQACEERDKSHALKEQEFTKLNDQLDSRAVAITEIAQEQDGRENDLNAFAEELKTKQDVLQKEKQDFVLTLAKELKKIEAREENLEREVHKLASLIESNKVLREEMERRIKENEIEKKAINDGYQSLARARREILGRDT